MRSEKTKKVKKKKLKLGVIFSIVIIITIFSFSTFTLYNMPIKNIKITGTNLLTDLEIIEIANIKEYPKIFQNSTKKMVKNIESLDLVKKVKINKKLNGTLSIIVEENKVLFYSRAKDKVVLSDGSEVEMNSNYMGLPTLINFVPDAVYEKFILGLDKIDYTLINLINVIEYSEFKSGDTVIDDTRFLLRMNDGNLVYVNIMNISKLNNYREIFATLKEGPRQIFLDSSSSSISIKPLDDETESSKDL